MWYCSSISMKKTRKIDFPVRTKYLFVLLLAAFAAALIRCGGMEEQGQPEYAGLRPDAEYAGMEACRSCHADIYKTFSHTGMGQSFEASSLARSAAGPGPHAPVYDPHLDFYYMAEWRNDSLFILEYRLSDGDTLHARRQFIHYIVGSGQHTNSHIYNRNGYLHQAPLTFYTQNEKWDLPPGYENGGNSRFSRMIGLECISCHNALPEMVLGSENKYTAIGNGIDCERCHGPGARHVAEKRAGKLVDIRTETDYTIVNPAKLEPGLQFDVCQRCHIQGNAVLREGKSFFDFRPGMQLSDVMHIFMPVWQGMEDEHIMASHAERLKMSLCFKSPASPEDDSGAGHAPLTCITCHDPHVSVRQTSSSSFNNACFGCHTDKDEDCTAPREDLEHEGFNCVHCHMEGSGTIDIPHVKVTDHFIRKPVSDSLVERIRTFVGIECIHAPDAPPEARGMAYIQYYEKFGFDRFALDSAKKYFPEGTNADVRRFLHQLVHIAFLEKDYRRVVDLRRRAGIEAGSFGITSWSNRDAWSCYRIGEAMRGLGVEGALGFLDRAAELAPYNLEFRSVYGTALMEAGRTADAKKAFRFILEEFPDHVQAMSNLGYILLSTEGDTTGSYDLYMRALSLDPGFLSARYNLAGWYLYRQRFTEAKHTLQEILRDHPGEQRARSILSSLPAPP